MKQYLLLVMVFLFQISNAQECKVLMAALEGEYKGECKKGKAHGEGEAIGMDTYKGEFKKGWPEGKGTYIWKNGDVFEGEFRKGEKHGEGTLYHKVKDSVVKGFWKNDIYKGLYERSFKNIEKSQNVSAVNFSKIEENIQGVRISIKEGQQLINYPRVTIAVLDGRFQTQNNQNNFVELTNVTYPVKLKVLYKQDYFVFEISEPGLWQITTDFTYIKGLGN